MIDVEETMLIGYSAEQMFSLITDIRDYSNFLPWCDSVGIYEQTEASLNVRVDIAFEGIHQFFRMRNVQIRPICIGMTFADGPFKSFTGFWTSTPLRADTYRINSHLRYEFSSVILEKLIGLVPSMIVDAFVNSFIKRTEAIYGES